MTPVPASDPTAEISTLNLEVLKVEVGETDFKWTSPKESHDFFEMGYLIEGKMEYSLQGEKAIADPGDMFFNRPRQFHYESAPEDAFVSVVYIQFRARGKAKRPPLGGFPRLIRFGRDNLVHDTLNRIVNEYFYKRSGYELVGRACLTELLVRAARKLASGEDDPASDAHKPAKRVRLLDEVLHYIRKHYRENLTLKKMSAFCLFSPEYFSTIFRKKHGVTPVEYLIRTRIEKAKELLGDPRLPVKQVAREVGFADNHYFSRTFRQREGVTPTEYRRSRNRSGQKTVKKAIKQFRENRE